MDDILKFAINQVADLDLFLEFKRKIIIAIKYLIDNDYLQYIDRVYLFGSCSKGCATAMSDIDIAIDFNETATRRVIAYVRSELMDLDGLPIEVQVTKVPKTECRLKSEIEKGVLLYEK